MKQKININKIKGNPSNPRIIKDEKFKKLVKSINGFPEMLEKRPIVVDEDMMVLGGNMRWKACKDAGLKEVWIDVAEGWTQEQKDEFIIKDNANFGEWDWDILANEWDSVQLAEWGLDVWQNEDDKIAEIGLIEDDEIPEVKESKVKRGDIWKLGEHRVMCGDSTSSDDVEKLMNGEKADMVFTDPPYGVSYKGGVIHGNKINTNNKRDMLKNDEIDIYSDFISLIPLIIDNGAIYIFYAIKYSYEIYKPLKDNNIDVMSVLAWVKINTGYADMNSHYKNRYEPFVYCKAGSKTNFIGSTTENTTWEIKKDRVNKLHPTQKPIEVPLRAIGNHKANIVADLFLGSGTTLIAAEKLNRKCYGMELDEKYCDVIIERWEQFTGQKAIKNGTE